MEAVIFHSLVFYIERLPHVGAQKFPYPLHLRRSMLISFKAETSKAGNLHPEVGRSESANENAHRARLGGNTEVDRKEVWPDEGRSTPLSLRGQLLLMCC